MEMLAEFAMIVQKGENVLSQDIGKGYRHMCLHPSMRDWIMVTYGQRYYRCVTLPFGWGAFMVHKVYDSVCARGATLRTSRARVSGRFPSGASLVRYNGRVAGLSGRSKADRRANGPNGSTAIHGEGRVDWGHMRRKSRGHD